MTSTQAPDIRLARLSVANIQTLFQFYHKKRENRHKKYQFIYINEGEKANKRVFSILFRKNFVPLYPHPPHAVAVDLARDTER